MAPSESRCLTYLRYHNPHQGHIRMLQVMVRGRESRREELTKGDAVILHDVNTKSFLDNTEQYQGESLPPAFVSVSLTSPYGFVVFKSVPHRSADSILHSLSSDTLCQGGSHLLLSSETYLLLSYSLLFQEEQGFSCIFPSTVTWSFHRGQFYVDFSKIRQCLRHTSTSRNRKSLAMSL